VEGIEANKAVAAANEIGDEENLILTEFNINSYLICSLVIKRQIVRPNWNECDLEQVSAHGNQMPDKKSVGGYKVKERS